jgi:hypothetical protein
MKKLLIGISLIAACLVSVSAQKTVIEIIEPKKKKAFIEVKEGAKPDVYIDAKKYDSDILEILDIDKIESVSVLKGESAMAAYGVENVIVIITKDAVEEKSNSTIIIRGSDKLNNDLDEENPVIVVDGEVKDRDYLEKLSPNDIESVSVLKDEKSMKKYNTTNGVIIIKTKKQE